MSEAKVQYSNFSFYSEKILVRKFNGAIQASDIIDSWKYVLRNNMISNEIKGVANDICNTELLMDMNSFGELMSYIKKNPVLSKLKLAVICDTPDKTVFPVVGNMENKELRIKPFSTMEAAARWILEV